MRSIVQIRSNLNYTKLKDTLDNLKKNYENKKYEISPLGSAVMHTSI